MAEPVLMAGHVCRKDGVMKRIKLTVAYDGTNYCGWQLQKNGITVEQRLNEAITELTGE